MLLVDAHCHLQDRQFEADRPQVLGRAREAGVRALVVVGWDLPSSQQAVELADEHPDLYAVVGLHPHYASRLDRRALRALRRLAHSAKVVAIGETGLDFYRHLSPPEDQRRAFHAQLELAAELRLPVVVHSREADQETFAVLSRYERAVLPQWPKDRPLGQMHCFAGDLPLALRYVQMGFLISLPATCTYPRSERVGTVARGIPLRWLTVETDAPYLPPQPRRGQRNEPCYLPETVRALARLRGEEPERVAAGTALAAAWLFGLGDLGGEEGA
jgi:TatD DNase family protein